MEMRLFYTGDDTSVRDIAETLGVGRGTVHRFLVSQKRGGSAPAKLL